MNRRHFMIATAAAAACSMMGRPADAWSAAAAKGPVDVGHPTHYPADTIEARFLKPHKLLVVRSGGRIHAMTAVCTHKSCVLKVAGTKLTCPCHGSGFSNHGRVTDGPARTSLRRFRITLDESGRLIVDPSRQFAERDWDAPESFVRVS
jgi:cytochrome b6-f complex iron-sulfur subunit